MKHFGEHEDGDRAALDRTLADLRLRDAAPALLASLRRIVDTGIVGKWALLQYYHDTASCECPAVCEHCLADREARTAIAAAEGAAPEQGPE